MSGQKFASAPLCFQLAICVLGTAAVGDAASARQAFLKLGESVSSNAVEIKHRRGHRLQPPIAPSYLAYDYPYYYRRGYYPKHIGPGYVYPASPHRPGKRYVGRCASSKCVAKARHTRGLRHRREACRCR